MAALTVVLDHARQAIFGNYASDFSGAPDIVIKGFFVLSGMGTQAVMCFFVMSGLLIAPKFLNGRELTPEYLCDYAVSRLARIWIVAIPALVLSFFAAHAAMRYFGASHYYAGNNCVPTVGDLLTNAAFLNKAFFPTICSNDPYWSIHNEMMYYALWPTLVAMVAASSQKLRWAAGLFVLVAILLLLAFDPLDLHNTLLLFPMWIAGGLCLAIVRSRGSLSTWGVAVVGALLLVNMVDLHWWIEAVVVAAPLVGFFRAAQDSAGGVPLILIGFFAWLARISFSLYLVHIIVINLLHTWVEFGAGRAVPYRSFGVESVSLYVIAIVCSVCLAQIFYIAFERHTAVLRRGLAAATSKRAEKNSAR